MAKASIESVFNGAAVGGAKGSLVSPGVEGVQVLLAGSDESVSIDAIRKVYKEQEWDENASLDLQQFTMLWTATVGDKDVMPVKLREVPAVAEKFSESSGDGVMSRAEAVFCGAAVGDAKGWLASPWGRRGAYVVGRFRRISFCRGYSQSL